VVGCLRRHVGDQVDPLPRSSDSARSHSRRGQRSGSSTGETAKHVANAFVALVERGADQNATPELEPLGRP
jgi:hypothetical protein